MSHSGHDFDAIFDGIDVDSSGYLDPEELLSCHKSMHMCDLDILQVEKVLRKYFGIKEDDNNGSNSELNSSHDSLSSESNLAPLDGSKASAKGKKSSKSSKSPSLRPSPSPLHKRALSPRPSETGDEEMRVYKEDFAVVLQQIQKRCCALDRLRWDFRFFDIENNNTISVAQFKILAQATLGRIFSQEAFDSFLESRPSPDRPLAFEEVEKALLDRFAS
eukprot:GCRY01001301.1.p1 GENE.GCRY01001301.1~~GCRY01001301.1.p1  ORF type:complete len:219 (+),score=26.61 GCRY01001301.1:704-1360(+)